jgi:TonB family protein
MKRTIVAILALSPVLLHAQAKSSAQPVSTPVLQSSVIQPAVLAATHSAATTGTTSAPVRISTGVVAPQILTAANPNLYHVLQGAGTRTVVIELTVDEKGKPANLHVVQSTDKFTDRAVVEAVSQYVYKPGTLDGEAIPMNVVMHYVIQ